MKFKFTIQVLVYLHNWQTKRSKLAAKDFQTAEFHQDTWNCYLMLGFVSAHIAWNATSNLKLRQSRNVSRSDFLLPSASTLSRICRREYTPTVYAAKKQLPSRNNVSLALDGWTSTNKLAITLVIANYVDWDWVLWEVQLQFDEVDSPFISYFENSLSITGQGWAAKNTASRTIERRFWPFWADWRPFTSKYN